MHKQTNNQSIIRNSEVRKRLQAGPVFDTYKSNNERARLKGHNMQHSNHMGRHFSNWKKTIEMQLVMPTEVCGKVKSEKNG